MREGRGRGWPGPRVGSTERGPSWEVGCGLWEGASLTAPSGPPRHQGAHCGEVVPPAHPAHISLAPEAASLSRRSAAMVSARRRRSPPPSAAIRRPLRADAAPAAAPGTRELTEGLWEGREPGGGRRAGDGGGGPSGGPAP